MTTKQRLCVDVSMVTRLQHTDENSTSMDNRLQQKTEREEQNRYMASRRESADTPTVGSAQERAFQQQLDKFGIQKKCKVSKNAHSFMCEEDEKDTNDIDIKDLRIYDSLEVDARPCLKGSTTQFHMDTAENKSGIEGESKMVSESIYSELCYDPKMMSNLSGDGSPSPSLHHDNVTERSADMDDPRTSDAFSHSQNNVTRQTGFGGNSACDVHPEVGEAGPVQGNNKSESDINLQSGVTVCKNLERQEDIVERNKITLGRNAFPGGSYMMAYAHKQGLVHNGNKVAHICKEKKGQRKESPSLPLQNEQPSALGVSAKQEDCLNTPSEKLAAVCQPKTQWMTSLPPNCHPKIHKPAHLLPPVQQRAQDAVQPNAASTYLGPASLADRTPEYQERDHEKFTQMSQQEAVSPAYQVNPVTSPVLGQRIAATTWVLPSEGDDHKWITDEFQCIASPQRAPRTPTSPASLSLGLDTYSVLPPVGKPPTGEELEFSPGQSANTADNIHRSSSDSYLGQMGKQKQLGATYKAYSLKDYNQLQLNITLRGLGPDYKAVEEAAEKMRRQRLYSNVIREQNKKISRIPILPAKNLQSTDKKVPRVKALEYAKTIVKPCTQPQAKQRQQGHLKDYEEQAPAAKGQNMFPPDTLALLLKRHEEEKKAAAQRVHVV